MTMVNKVGRSVAARCLVAASVLLGTASPANAIPLIYTLNGVSFSDGATATGSFTIDSSYGYMSTFDITTTNGAFAGFNYTPAINSNINNVGGFGPDTITLFNRTGYNGYLQLSFATPLWLPGVFVQPSSDGLVPQSYECSSYENFLTSDFTSGFCPTSAIRRDATGGVTGGAPVRVSEPSILLLFGTGLLALLAARRRSRGGQVHA